MDYFHKFIPIIRRSLDEGFIRRDWTAGEPATGCIPRDYNVDPVLMSDSPDGMKLYDQSEYDAVFDEQEEQESSLEHIYLDGVATGGKPAFELLDQNGFPDCWTHSTLHAVMLDRMKRNFPVIRFNGVAMATLLNQLNGGWSGLSAKDIVANGCPVIGTGPGQWPLHSRNRKYDTPELRENMARHKIQEGWYDFGKKEWNQTLSKQQIATCGLSNIPGALDFNRFGHAMAMMRFVRFEKNAWGPLVFNSWKGWGYHGLGVLAEIYPDNAIAVRSTTPSVA